MKHKRKIPHHDLETLTPLLIEQWRKFRGIGGPNDKLQTREFRSVVEEIAKMEENFGLRDDFNPEYLLNRESLGAYILYYWIMHYQEGLSLINELPEAPRRVLDICSGTAPYAFAALQHGATDVYATDRDLNALTLGAQICGRYGKTVTIRKWNCPKESCPVEGQFDLIILAHGLEEIFSSTQKGWRQAQDHFIQSLFHKLTPDGYLLIVDSSKLHTNQRILELRDALVKEGIPVQAPCVWKGECPALKIKNSPCYAQRDFERPYLVKEIQRSARIKQSSLKMSYLLLRHPEAGWPNLPEKRLYRVVSPAIEGFNGKTFYLCGIDGKKKLTSHIQDHSKQTRSFEFLKRGELISIEGALTEGNHLHIVENTKITVEATCGKPMRFLETNGGL